METTEAIATAGIGLASLLGVSGGLALGGKAILGIIFKSLPPILELINKSKEEDRAKEREKLDKEKEILVLRDKVQNKDIEKTEAMIKFMEAKMETLGDRVMLATSHANAVREEGAKMRGQMSEMSTALRHLEGRVNENTEQLITWNANTDTLHKLNDYLTKIRKRQDAGEAAPEAARPDTPEFEPVPTTGSTQAPRGSSEQIKSTVKDLGGGFVRVEERKPPAKG